MAVDYGQKQGGTSGGTFAPVREIKQEGQGGIVIVEKDDTIFLALLSGVIAQKGISHFGTGVSAKTAESRVKEMLAAGEKIRQALLSA